jgi:hypothetical protein
MLQWLACKKKGAMLEPGINAHRELVTRHELDPSITSPQAGRCAKRNEECCT